MSIAAARLTTSVRPKPMLHVALWLVQLLLLLSFGAAGAMKATQPLPMLLERLPWAADVPLALVRVIGVAELLGALGLVLPAATRIRPGLTPLAALGLLTIMLLAAAFHLGRGEPVGAALPSLVLGALAAFVAWGRGRAAPIAPRA